MQKAISVLALIGALAATAAADLGTINPKWALGASVVATVATAASRALTRYAIKGWWAIIGVAAAVAAALSTYSDVISSKYAMYLALGASILGAAARGLSSEPAAQPEKEQNNDEVA